MAKPCGCYDSLDSHSLVICTDRIFNRDIPMQQTIQIANTSDTIRRVIKDQQIRFNNERYLVSEHESGNYIVDLSRPIRSPLDLHSDDDIVRKAFEILKTRSENSKGSFIESPDAAKDLFRLHNSGLQDEYFSVAFLNNRHSLLPDGIQVLFRGGAASCTVHPEVVARECLKRNAKACLIFHNHPSNQSCQPSTADVNISTRLKKVLSLIDVRLIDSIVTVDGETCSLAERGDL